MYALEDEATAWQRLLNVHKQTLRSARCHTVCVLALFRAAIVPRDIIPVRLHCSEVFRQDILRDAKYIAHALDDGSAAVLVRNTLSS